MIPPEDLVNYPADNKSDDKKDEEDYQGFFGNHGKHDVGFVSAGGDHGAGKRPKTDRVVCVERDDRKGAKTSGYHPEEGSNKILPPPVFG